MFEKFSSQIGQNPSFTVKIPFSLKMTDTCFPCYLAWGSRTRAEFHYSVTPTQEFDLETSTIPGLGRSPEGRNGNPLQYSCLENPLDRGAWRATVHGIAKSQTRMSIWATVLEKPSPGGGSNSSFPGAAVPPTATRGSGFAGALV